MMTPWNCIKIFLLLAPLSWSQNAFTISQDSFRDMVSSRVSDQWKYNPGDNPGWAKPAFNDSSWLTVSPQIHPDSKIAADWRGSGWFRLTFNIDSSLYNKTFRISFYSAGDLSFYYNGKLAFTQPDDKNLHSPFVTITFNDRQKQVFAVKFTNRNIKKFNDAGIMAGFDPYWGPADKYNSALLDYNVSVKSYQMFFLGITLGFCLLHLILFIYYREVKSNFYFAVFLFVYALSTYFDYAHSVHTTVTVFLTEIRLHRLLVAISSIASVRLIYSLFNKKTNIIFWVFAVSVFTAGAFAYMKPLENFDYLEILNLAGVAIIVYLFITALSEGQKHVWLIAAGFIMVFAFSIYDLVMDFGLINPVLNITNGYPFGLLGLFICISIYLAKDIADRNNTIIEQEKVVKEKEIREKILQKENDRKKAELEEARSLQLSMLPVCLNNFQDFDTCFDMRTATEVGGDYYDYSTRPDGTLNIVIGDATGHGVKAGLMVATFKSLFGALGSDLEITEFLQRSNEIVKQMKLGNLFMAFSFIRFTKKSFEITNAGMPPCLHYRKKTNDVERIIIKSMPLGSPLGLSYRIEKRNLEPGDIILLMSDGLEELFNEKMEMLGLDKIRETLINNSSASASQIISKMLSLGKAWRGNKQQHDDITLIAVKIL